jgi:pimeloyl-ACP methyl ester carboxylesterase
MMLSGCVKAALVGVAISAGWSSGAAADTNDLLKGLILVCVGGGSEDRLESQGQADVALTLRKLRTGDLGGSGGIAVKYSRAEWVGLVGGISTQMTEAQAGQADKVRDCLRPYMANIVDAILKANK